MSNSTPQPLSLREIGYFYGGLTGKSGKDFGRGNSKYITFMNVINNVVAKNDLTEFVEIKDGERQNKVSKGDLLFNGSSETPEEVAFPSLVTSDLEGLYLNSFCFGFRFEKLDKIDPLFFAYYLRSNYGRQFMSQLAQGSTRYNISKRALLDIEWNLPKVKEQKAIAEVLRDTDGLIDRTQNLIKKKVSLLSGVKFKIFRETNDWKSEKLGDLARIYQPETISAKHLTNFGYPVYGANGIVGLYEKYNHSTWQTLITCRGSTCGTVNKTSDYVWITGNAMVVNIDDNKSLNKKFFYHLISVQDFSKCITGTGQPQIVRRPLEAFQVIFPEDVKEQERICLLLDDLDNEITLLEGELEKLLNLKQAVLSDLLTGKVRLV